MFQYRFFKIGTGYESTTFFLAKARCGHSYGNKTMKKITDAKNMLLCVIVPESDLYLMMPHLNRECFILVQVTVYVLKRKSKTTGENIVDVMSQCGYGCWSFFVCVFVRCC